MAVVLGGLVLMVAAKAAGAPDSAGDPRDVLAYKNGDRLQGKLIGEANGMIVFQSERFGELHVPAANAVVIKAEKPPAPAAGAQAALSAASAAATPAAAAAQAKTRAADHAEEERFSLWERFSLPVLTAKVRNYFGPWHGKFAFSTELVSDSVRHSDVAVEAHLQRKWKSDEVQLDSQYDYSEASGLTTTDVLKADGSWRHDFSQDRFALYRPTVEWNRANVKDGVPSDYVLLQQEVGAGLNLLSKPTRKVRLGLSENLFHVWNTGLAPTQSSRAAGSTFEETEFKLPWRMTFTQRGVWYNPFLPGRVGWENTVEVAQKLTETLSVSLRHEIRRNNPDGTSQDYTRLKLLLGLDF